MNFTPKEELKRRLQQLFGETEIRETELIQRLWSDYGQLIRLHLSDSEAKSIILKNITLPAQSNHPRGWNTNQSHLRKVKSYQVEVEWYKNWAHRCSGNCRVPISYQSISEGVEHTIILEDLDAAGFPLRKTNLNPIEAQLGLKWLAYFHATFMNESPTNLWNEGTYWHLATRPDEFAKMEAGALKENASKLNDALSNCKFKTLIHGDAKVANFCFANNMERAAAVDFQYVGGGCGMKDVAYFLGSCLTEPECEVHEEALISYYFEELHKALIERGTANNFIELEKEWRIMFPVAWADFTRFLLGWMPSHQKVNRYSLSMTERALEAL